MIKRILESLAERRTQLKDEDKGFTLIELLVVVIIIGVLVAIAIPVYIGLQDGAKDSAAKSDLTNAKIATVAFYAENPSGTPVLPTPTALNSNLAPYGAVLSSGVTGLAYGAVTGTQSATNFCISAVSAVGGPDHTFHITQSSAVLDGGC